MSRKDKDIDVEKLVTRITSKLATLADSAEEKKREEKIRQLVLQEPYPYNPSMLDNFLAAEEGETLYLSDHPTLHDQFTFYGENHGVNSSNILDSAPGVANGQELAQFPDKSTMRPAQRASLLMERNKPVQASRLSGADIHCYQEWWLHTVVNDIDSLFLEKFLKSFSKDEDPKPWGLVQYRSLAIVYNPQRYQLQKKMHNTEDQVLSVGVTLKLKKTSVVSDEEEGDAPEEFFSVYSLHLDFSLTREQATHAIMKLLLAHDHPVIVSVDANKDMLPPQGPPIRQVVPHAFTKMGFQSIAHTDGIIFKDDKGQISMNSSRSRCLDLRPKFSPLGPADYKFTVTGVNRDFWQEFHGALLLDTQNRQRKILHGITLEQYQAALRKEMHIPQGLYVCPLMTVEKSLPDGLQVELVLESGGLDYQSQMGMMFSTAETFLQCHEDKDIKIMFNDTRKKPEKYQFTALNAKGIQKLDHLFKLHATYLLPGANRIHQQWPQVLVTLKKQKDQSKPELIVSISRFDYKKSLSIALVGTLSKKISSKLGREIKPTYEMIQTIDPDDSSSIDSYQVRIPFSEAEVATWGPNAAACLLIIEETLREVFPQSFKIPVEASLSFGRTREVSLAELHKRWCEKISCSPDKLKVILAPAKYPLIVLVFSDDIQFTPPEAVTLIRKDGTVTLQFFADVLGDVIHLIDQVKIVAKPKPPEQKEEQQAPALRKKQIDDETEFLASMSGDPLLRLMAYEDPEQKTSKIITYELLCGADWVGYLLKKCSGLVTANPENSQRVSILPGNWPQVRQVLIDFYSPLTEIKSPEGQSRIKLIRVMNEKADLGRLTGISPADCQFFELYFFKKYGKMLPSLSKPFDTLWLPADWHLLETEIQHFYYQAIIPPVEIQPLEGESQKAEPLSLSEYEGFLQKNLFDPGLKVSLGFDSYGNPCVQIHCSKDSVFLNLKALISHEKNMDFPNDKTKIILVPFKKIKSFNSKLVEQFILKRRGFLVEIMETAENDGYLSEFFKDSKKSLVPRAPKSDPESQQHWRYYSWLLHNYQAMKDQLLPIDQMFLFEKVKLARDKFNTQHALLKTTHLVVADIDGTVRPLPSTKHFEEEINLALVEDVSKLAPRGVPVIWLLTNQDLRELYQFYTAFFPADAMKHIQNRFYGDGDDQKFTQQDLVNIDKFTFEKALSFSNRAVVEKFRSALSFKQVHSHIRVKYRYSPWDNLIEMRMQQFSAIMADLSTISCYQYLLLLPMYCAFPNLKTQLELRVKKANELLREMNTQLMQFYQQNQIPDYKVDADLSSLQAEVQTIDEQARNVWMGWQLAVKRADAIVSKYEHAIQYILQIKGLDLEAAKNKSHNLRTIIGDKPNEVMLTFYDDGARNLKNVTQAFGGVVRELRTVRVSPNPTTGKLQLSEWGLVKLGEKLSPTSRGLFAASNSTIIFINIESFCAAARQGKLNFNFVKELQSRILPGQSCLIYGVNTLTLEGIFKHYLDFVNVNIDKIDEFKNDQDTPDLKAIDLYVYQRIEMLALDNMAKQLQASIKKVDPRLQVKTSYCYTPWDPQASMVVTHFVKALGHLLGIMIYESLELLESFCQDPADLDILVARMESAEESLGIIENSIRDLGGEIKLGPKPATEGLSSFEKVAASKLSIQNRLTAVMKYDLLVRHKLKEQFEDQVEMKRIPSQTYHVDHVIRDCKAVPGKTTLVVYNHDKDSLDLLADSFKDRGFELHLIELDDSELQVKPREVIPAQKPKVEVADSLDL